MTGSKPCQVCNLSRRRLTLLRKYRKTGKFIVSSKSYLTSIGCLLTWQNRGSSCYLHTQEKPKERMERIMMTNCWQLTKRRNLFINLRSRMAVTAMTTRNQARASSHSRSSPSWTSPLKKSRWIATATNSWVARRRRKIEEALSIYLLLLLT